MYPAKNYSTQIMNSVTHTNSNRTSSNVFPRNTSEYLCNLNLRSHSETVNARPWGLNAQLICSAQDWRGNDGVTVGDVTGEPLGDTEGDGYDVTSAVGGRATWSDTRDFSTEECRLLVLNLGVLLFTTEVLLERAALTDGNMAPKTENGERNYKNVVYYKHIYYKGDIKL